MKKSNGKNKLFLIIVITILSAVLVSGSVIVAMVKTAMKPTEFNFVTPASGEGTGYYRYCYDELNENEKKVYSVILQNIYQMPEKIEIPPLGDGVLDKIFEALSYDNPDLFFLGTNCTVYEEGYKTYFEPVYTMTFEEYSSRLSQAKAIADVIIKGTETYTSVYEKELYVHDYIVGHCSYADAESSPNANSMYGCLVEGKASCEGYSRTFQYIMSAMNIDNRLITGESAEDGVNYIGHMWNYVVIDGEGYFVDLTWDDPKSETSIIHHTYFNVNTNDILIGHRNIKQVVPLCTSRKYNFFVYENCYFTVGSGEEFDTAVENAVHNAIQRKYNGVELRFSDATTLALAKDTLFKSGTIYNVYSSTGLLTNSENSMVYYSMNDDMNTISLFF